MTSIFDKIRNWAQVRGLLDSGDVKTQYIKLTEETGELAKAILKSNEEEFVDSIGDAIVVLTNLTEIYARVNNKPHITIEYCIDHAYEQIKDRKGKMVDGTYVKEE